MKAIGFLGIGKMGSALARSFSRDRARYRVFAYDICASPEFVQQWPELDFVGNVRELEDQVELLVLCVKPQDMAHAISPLKGNKRYVSIAAGVSMAKLCNDLQAPASSIARVMPNLCVLNASAVSAIYCEEDSLFDLVETMFRLVGMTLRVDREEQLHAITALSGSGPALVAAFAEAMVDGGVAGGLGYDLSLRLTLQTMKGSLDLLSEQDMKPSQLREQVSSPAGTTMSALRHLSKHDFHNTVIMALAAAEKRSRELELGE